MPQNNDLTWRDVQSIVRIAGNLLNTLDYDKIKKMGEEGYYTEILNQFNKERNAVLLQQQNNQR